MSEIVPPEIRYSDIDLSSITKTQNFTELQELETEYSWRSRYAQWFRSKPYNPITLMFYDKANSNMFRQ